MTVTASGPALEKSPSSIREFRLEIDRFINSTQHLALSREISLAHTNFQRAKMWLGKALGETGAKTPYTNSENASNATIEPQAEHTENNLLSRWEDIEPTQVARVKDFRFISQVCVDAFKRFTETSEGAGKDYDLYLQQARLALEEAKMWLGWELDRIRNSQN